MSWQQIRPILRSDYLMLLLIMLLAFYLAFIPHHNYPYPVHLDEWNHLACSNEIIKEATIVELTDPFSGGKPIPNQLLEIGFYLFWVVFHQISGVPWLDIFKYFPGIVFLITVLSVYILAKRQGFGLEAALFTCLIPTTVGILGPGFLVPVAMGLLFIPLSLFTVFNFRGWQSYVVLSIFTFFLVSLHSATAIGLLIILTPFILLNLKGNFRHSLGMTLALAIPFLVAVVFLPEILHMLVLPSARSLFSPKPLLGFVELPQVIPTYGYLPLLLCLLGTFLLGIRGRKENYGLVLALLALLVMLATFFTLHYGIPMMYYRGLMYVMLMASIVAGAGLMWVRSLRLPGKFATGLKSTWLPKNVGNILCTILIGLTLIIAIPDRQGTPYYHMLDSEDYQAFVWIKDNVGNEYERAILDPSVSA